MVMGLRVDLEQRWEGTEGALLFMNLRKFWWSLRVLRKRTINLLFMLGLREYCRREKMGMVRF